MGETATTAFDALIPAHQSEDRRRARLFLFAGMILFLLQTVPFLSYRWLPDESWYAAPGFSVLHGQGVRDPAIGPNDIENRFDARPPGTALVVSVLFRLFGVSSISARSGSLLAGLCIIYLVYKLTFEEFGWLGSGIAVLLISTDNFIVLAARTVRPEALATASVLFALLLLRSYARTRLLRWAGLAGCLMALATMFHITVFGYVVALGLLTVLITIQRGVWSSLRGLSVYIVGYLASLIPAVIWICHSSLGRQGFSQEYLSRLTSSGFVNKVLAEGQRYAPVFGFANLHGHGIASLPLRLPIPLAFAAASIILYRLRKQYVYLELLLLLPAAVWLIYTVNKSPRYVALLAPIFAMVVGAAAAALYARRQYFRTALVVVMLMVLSQIGANLVLLREASKANYPHVASELRTMIPPTATVYGTITFWLAFHDQPFVSYERTTPWMAANSFGARYFVTGDKVSVNGLPGDEQFYQDLKQEIGDVRSHSTLVGRVSDSYYGDLMVYRLDH